VNREGNAALHPTLYVRSCLHRQDGSRPYPVGRYARRPTTKISGSVAFKAPLCTISNISPGPPVGAPLSVRAPLGHIKGRAHPLEHRLTQARPSDARADTPSLSQHKLGFIPNNPALNLLRAQAIQHTVDVGYYAPAARTTLNLLCSSRSSTKIGLILANPRVLTLWV